MWAFVDVTQIEHQIQHHVHGDGNPNLDLNALHHAGLESVQGEGQSVLPLRDLGKDVESAVIADGLLLGVGLDVAKIDKTTKAFIDSGVIATVKGDIDVDADSSEDITSVAAGLSASGSR